MKALVYRRFGAPEVLAWTDWPTPTATDDTVLVRVAAGGLNPKDALLRKGKFSRTLAREPLPRVSGLDAAGRVVAVGRRVTGFAVGDAVFGMSNRFAGGVHAELALFAPDEIAPAPAGVSLTTAAGVPLAAQTALQALRDCAALQPGQKVLINGASGGVGHFAVQIAKAMGLFVHAVCGPHNAAFVASLGADAVDAYDRRPAVDVDARFDAVFDVFGKLARPAFARQLGGRGVYVSTVPKPATIWGEALAQLGLAHTARLVRVVSRAADLCQLAAWIDAGALVPRVERVYPVAVAAEAHRRLETRRVVGKLCLEMPASELAPSPAPA